MHHRTYSVGHSYAGFTIGVRDEWLPAVLTERAVDGLLAVLGHPCCGKGLGRIPATDGLWARIMNAGSGMHRRDKLIAQIPITTAQAFAIAPWYADSIGPDGYITVDGEDEDGDVWDDARLVAVRCPDCGELVDAAGRWSVKVLEEHRCG